MTLQQHTPTSNAKDLTFVKTRRQNRNPNVSQRRIVLGADTETDNGNIFLLMLSNGEKLESPNITFENIAEFLLKHEGDWIFFYNLQYDAQCILKLLPKDILETYKITNRLDFTYNDYDIRYIPKKQLTIRKGKHSISCYDIAQYFDGKSLDKAYDEHIKKSLDQKYMDTKNNRKKFSLRYFLRNKKLMREYCLQDCILTQELSDCWLDTFYETFGFYPANWISSGYLAEKVLVFNEVSMALFTDIPYEIQDLAWKSFYGGRFELIQRGYIGECYIYDINSAYPYALTFLPDLTNGKWIESTRINPKASVGFFHIRAYISSDVKIAPFPFRANGTVLFPSGKFETYVTLPELLACKEKLYRILEGYQFIPSTDSYPYREFIQNLYAKRMKLKKQNNPMQLPIKIILNAIYGKTGAKTDGVTGNIFNPVIFSHITGYARAQLYSMVNQHKLDSDVVFFATDSICSRRKLDVNSEKLGEFSFDDEADDIQVLQNGIYRFNGKWKKRGLGQLQGKDIEHLDTFEKDNRLFIKYLEKRNTTIKMAIIQNKISDIGKIKEKIKQIDLNADRKRQWFGKLTGISDGSYNDSMPLSLNWISKDRI